MKGIYLLASLFAIVAVSSVTLAQTPMNTTTKTTPTTTKAPPTTTKTTPTTTKAPLTTTKTTPTTTKAPPTTTKAPPTTTTTVAPKEPKNTYNVTSGNVTCIQLVAKIDFAIKYEKKGEGNVTQSVPIPEVFTTSGTCGNDNQTLDIMFNNGWKLEFTFKTDGVEKYHVSNLVLTYILDNHFSDPVSQGATKTAVFATSKDFMKANKNGYVCKSKVGEKSGDVILNTQDLKYKAFNDDSKIDLSTTGLECSADEDTNSIVPIAVGAALAGLVVIVLIAYLIGRKRTRKTGYESV